MGLGAPPISPSSSLFLLGLLCGALLAAKEEEKQEEEEENGTKCPALRS